MKHQKNRYSILLGAHISIAGGFEKSIERALSIGCTCMQIFTKSNRQWYAKPIGIEQAEIFKKAKQNAPILKIIGAHASYLLNIASANKELNKKSAESLLIELERCEDLDIPYLILHPGSYTGSTIEHCLELAIKNINHLFSVFKGKTMLLLENTAGQGNTLCSTFEELKIIYEQVKEKKRLGFCLDTCHAFAAGYDLRTPSTYQKTWETFNQVLGMENLKFIHVNDSQKNLGSHIDRHADIGKGKIGLKGFSLLFNDKKLSHIPKVLETPKEHGLEDDKRNMEVIYGLLK